MQDRKRHDKQDKFSEITKAILGYCFDVINTLLSVGLLANFGKRKLEYRRVNHPANHAACDHANPVPF
jgi:hypothetical protein